MFTTYKDMYYSIDDERKYSSYKGTVGKIADNY